MCLKINSLRPSDAYMHQKPKPSLAQIISLKFVPKGQINNIPSLVQIMAWRQPVDKPLSETMMGRLLMHICIIRPQWVDEKSTMIQAMAWCLSPGTKWVNDWLIDHELNSLWPSHTMRWPMYLGNTLFPVMAYCLTAPYHYLNFICWLINSEGSVTFWKSSSNQSLKWVRKFHCYNQSPISQGPRSYKVIVKIQCLCIIREHDS